MASVIGILLIATSLDVAPFVAKAEFPIQREKWGPPKEKGQSNGEKLEQAYAPREPLSCESLAALLDTLVIDAHKLKDSYLSIIVRSGKGERTDQLARIRFNKIEAYLKRFGTSFVTAQGIRAEGLG